MKIIAWFILFTSAFFTISGCDELIEEDLTDTQLVVLAPQDSLLAGQNTLTFWWEENEDALLYRLQVVQPSFSGANTLIVDSTTTLNQFQWTFLPGSYQWRLRAENGSSVSDYVVRNFTIDSLGDLSTQTVIVQSPTNGAVINDATPIFDWEPVSSANEYRLELWTPDTFGTAVIIQVLITNDFFSPAQPLSDGSYQWGVRGQNNAFNTPFSWQSLTIDATAPDTPTLATPTDGDTATSGPIAFSWNQISDSGSPLIDSIHLADNNQFNNELRYAASGAGQYSDSLSAGTYYWRVRTSDAAGNQSAFSNVHQLIVQ